MDSERDGEPAEHRPEALCAGVDLLELGRGVGAGTWSGTLDSTPLIVVTVNVYRSTLRRPRMSSARP
ncbi:hypothetical protein [Amycolatopsis sp. cmx-11-12]|uniref:hypothetical protein n=1 Tax=Amycolatopsis sp. cmx-11-12 TaxID=2785795 RepID=UPI0039173349